MIKPVLLSSIDQRLPFFYWRAWRLVGYLKIWARNEKEEAFFHKTYLSVFRLSFLIFIGRSITGEAGLEVINM